MCFFVVFLFCFFRIGLFCYTLLFLTRDILYCGERDSSANREIPHVQYFRARRGKEAKGTGVAILRTCIGDLDARNQLHAFK